MKKYLIPLIVTLSSSFLMYTAFPPFSETQAAWFALVPVIVLARFKRPWASFRWGFFSGLLFWLFSISWLLALSKTGTNLPLAVLGWIVLSAYAALYNGAFLGITAFLMQRHDSRDDDESDVSGSGSLWNVVLVLLIPAVWVGLEYFRSIMFGGFPWNQYGVSQYSYLYIAQLAELGGVYAVSAVLLVMNTALALTGLRLADVYRRRKARTKFRVELMAGLVICAVALLYGGRSYNMKKFEPRPGTEVRGYLVQPNTPQTKKWDPDEEFAMYDRLRKYTSAAAMAKPSIIVWPETAVMRPINSCPTTMSFIKDLAALGSPVLVGSLESYQTDDQSDGGDEAYGYYNSSFLVGVDGSLQGVYRKQHLVPFGEFIPLERSVGLIGKMVPLGFSCTPGEQSTVFGLKVSAEEGEEDVKFSVLICFEDVFPGLARKAVLSGGRFLVNQTNDGWFDGTAASLQHMSHCVFRSIENRVPSVRSANTGVSCYIKEYGQVFPYSPPDTDLRYGRGIGGVMSFGIVVPGEKMDMTIYTRYGDVVLAIPCGVAVALIACFMVYLLADRKGWLSRCKERPGNAGESEGTAE